MPGLKEEIRELEGLKFDEAITGAGGNLKAAAESLDMLSSTLSMSLQRHYPELLDKARELRREHGNVLGRPRSGNPKHSRDAVQDAWVWSKHTLSVAARNLGVPPSTFRDLMIRHGLFKKRRRRG